MIFCITRAGVRRRYDGGTTIRRRELRTRIWTTLFLATGLYGSAIGAQQPATPPRTGDTLRLTVEDARALALRQNRELAATRLDVDIARGQLRQAGMFRNNPTFDVLTSGTSGLRPEMSLGQEVEIAGQRGLRRRSAESELSRATYSTRNAARLTVTDVDMLFYELFSATRRLELFQEVLVLNERLADVARRQMAEGEISKLDFNLANIELGRSRARAMAASREREAADIELRQLLALDRGTTIKPVVDSVHQHVTLDSTVAVVQAARPLTYMGAPIDELVSRAITQRPDVRALEASVDRAATDITVARREAIPNLIPRLSTETKASGSGIGVRPGIGLSLPFLNRNRGEIDARRAAAQQAELERSALTRRVLSEVEAAVRAYNAAAIEVEVLESTVLVPARENRVLLEAAYREGKVGIAVLLLMRNQVIDAELEYWAAWLAERHALALLAAAMGENLPTTTGAGQ